MLRRALQVATVVAALAAVAVGASAIADAASSGSTSTAAGGSASNQTQPAPRAGQHSAGPYPGETPLRGDTADKVRKAALDKVPGATVLRVETDAQGSPYEAHLRKSDGSLVTVKVDRQFDATAVQSGFGAGPGGGPPGAPR